MGRPLLFAMALTATLGLIALSALPANPPDLSGLYACNGTSPTGREYRALVEIAKHGDTFRLRWTFAGERSNLGIGIVSGEALAVSYYGGDSSGVVVYKIADGEKLVGEWTVAGADGHVYQETLTKLPAGSHPRTPATPEPRDRRERPQPAPEGTRPLVEA